MADPQSQPGAIALPELVERLQNGGEKAVAELSQDELEAVIDDLPLALESEAIRDYLSKLVGRIERQKHRTFRRIVEIARQDDERTTVLLAALKFLGFSGEPTDEEFAWLVHVMSTNTNAMARLDAFDQALRLALQPALQAILEAVATIHPDEAIRAQMAASRGETLSGLAEPGALMTSADFTSDLGEFSIPEPGTSGMAEPPAGSDASAWVDYEEKPPERLTVRTLLRSVDATSQIGPTGEMPPSGTEAPPPEAEAEAAEATPADDAAAWAAADEPAAPRLTVRTLLRSLEPDDAASQIGPPATDAPPAPPPGAGSAADDEAAWTATEATPQGPRRERETVRTTLADASAVPSSAPALPSPPPEPPAPPGGEAPPQESVETMLRSLETVKLSLRELETTQGVLPTPTALVSDRTPPPPRAGEMLAPPKTAAPWKELDLKPLSPPERARSLAKLRRELKPEDRRSFLMWLFERENDPLFGASIRREILEFAFERATFFAFDASTRQRLGRWIRERAAGDALTPAAILSSLRRATWAEGEPPKVEEETRPIVDAASGVLARVPSEERVSLLTRDFTSWLFAVREFEDREVLDRWARDPHPGVAEGLFRALAAMDASASKVGVTEGPTALELALGLWDRCDVEGRIPMANAIAAGWSRGFVLSRTRFFEGFWKRYTQNENQREAILVALASFEKEIEAARRREADGASTGPSAATPDAGAMPMPGFVAPPTEPAGIAPSAPPVREDSAPNEAKVLASLMGTRRPAPSGLFPSPPPTPIAAATPAPAVASTGAGVVPPPAPAPEEAEVTESDDDGAGDRYYTQKRRELEKVMRQVAGEAPSSPRDPIPDSPSEAPTDPRKKVSTSVDADDPIPEEGEAAPDFIPDEGGALLTDDERNSSAPKRLPRPPSPAVAPPSGPDHEVVLPNEPLRTLAEYTGFLRALSGGTSIDELLGRNGMDYRQYASCMTAWGKLLQSRPDLALRMGQLLRGN